MYTKKTGWLPPHGSQRVGKVPVLNLANEEDYPPEPMTACHCVNLQPSPEPHHEPKDYVVLKAILSPEQCSTLVTKEFRGEALSAEGNGMDTASWEHVGPSAYRGQLPVVEAEVETKDDSLVDCGRFEKLIHDHYVFIRKLARSYFANREDQEDLQSAVTLSAFRRFSTFDPLRGSFATWIATIVRNEANDMRRKQQKSPKTIEYDAASEMLIDSAVAINDLGSGNEMDWEAIRSQMPQNYWNAFRKVALEGQSCDDVARQMGTTSGTVRTYVWRARVLLKKWAKKAELVPARRRKSLVVCR